MISKFYFNSPTYSLYSQNKSNRGFHASELNELQNRFSELDGQSSMLSKEQKDYLKKKYNINDMIFSSDKNLAGDTDAFMNDLYNMGVISKKELATYSAPQFYVPKPANFDSLPEEIQKSFRDESLIAPGNQQTDVYGKNIKDAFNFLAIQQKQQADLCLGKNDKEMFLGYANMYKKLSTILDDIFG